ncbi:hypothetical protein [Paenibacillus glucanolyticus]|uniref:hypothetical protein n=1 Tax=Paenibacillus glucanolyticus TaxID=59843 RepID=UPI0034CE7FBE
MHKPVSKAKVKSYVGKEIVAYKKDGTVVTGKLVRVSGSRLFVIPATKGKKVKTKAIVPLALFDLLAIGTAPYAFGGGFGGYPGGYPGGYGGFGPGYGGYGPGFGPGFGGGFFW